MAEVSPYPADHRYPVASHGMFAEQIVRTWAAGRWVADRLGECHQGMGKMLVVIA